MKTIYLIISVLLFGCSDDNNQISSFENIDAAIDIAVKSEDQLDLLNPSNKSNFNFEDFRLFYSKDDEKIEMYNENLTYPRNLKLVEYPTEYRLRIFADIVGNSNQTILFIRWNETDEDTINCHFLKGENYLTVDKVSFNGNHVWDLSEDGDDRYFSIVK